MSQTVLIVDDDPVQRRLLEAMVSRFGYQAVIADGGDAAPGAACPGRARIDCVVLDLVMPDLDGLGVLARMRERRPSTFRSSCRPRMAASTTWCRRCAPAPSTSWSSRSSPERLQVSLRNALATQALAGELQRIKRSRDGTLTFADIVTRSRAPCARCCARPRRRRPPPSRC